MKSALRKVSYPNNRDMNELAGDVAKAFDAVVPAKVVSFTATYAEPMFIAFDHEPAGVLLIRMREDAAPETPNAFSAGVCFTYTSQGIRIDELEGPLLGTRYRFGFLVIG
jgi:hypothetical protein